MYIRAKVNRIDQTESVASRDISGLDPDQTIGNIVPQLLKTGENLDGLYITCVYCGEVLDLEKALGECEIDSLSILQFFI
ncbi:hypothetical protein T265_13826 [Opisthorchis viverrini]|uniref:Uncharacterized protein n=1 Tax=Opisthorchis viverrini TaxID=6198 RepID=A0A074ZJW4_OPIVI|nr:hypothetical protein T265_13826 [Opisthorchis viverrini]KER27316.1 hypothetical protein T265_13826 [Opisthorchis viverrini]